MSESKTIYSELSRIQKALKAPKSQYNKFGKYNYRTCEDILEAYKSVSGCTYLNLNDEMTLIGDRYYLKATATLSLDDKFVSVSAYAREPLAQAGMADPQVTGSTSSYARKYALNGLFCIDDTKDADSQDNSQSNTQNKSTNQQQKNGPSDKQKKMVADLLKNNNIPLTDALKGKLSSMSGKQMSDLIGYLMKEKVLPDELC